MLIYVTRVCPICKNKFAFRFSYSTIPPQFCDNCRRELMLKLRTKKSLETFWSELGDIPVNDDGIIQEPFLWWPKGTDREDIWHWFDEKYPGGVIKLMGLED